MWTKTGTSESRAAAAIAWVADMFARRSSTTRSNSVFSASSASALVCCCWLRSAKSGQNYPMTPQISPTPTGMAPSDPTSGLAASTSRCGSTSPPSASTALLTK